ncbi:uncharacterized protein LOC134275846 [Saccostrea cucullata]|uniref:uncharacterized protein LOC134275846 n=1 Tax=Saccostrea cuccullata TaxID=36930 RepID=UPI002ED4FA60
MAFILSLSGQDTEKKIHYGKRILDALIDIVQGVSFIECTEECISRRRCLSVNYWRSILLCEMNSVDTSDSSHVLSDEPRTVFADISLLEQHFVGGCKNHNCAINMKCVPGPFGAHRCEIADCGLLPSWKNAKEIQSKGQFLIIGVGSLRIFQCYPWTHEKKYRQKVICQSDGNWTHYQNTPCNLVTCATEVTSVETLDIDNKEIDVPYVYSEGHKWAVIQRRCFDNTNFYRGWSDYKAGFGNFKEKSDFWIGNDVIHMLSKNGYNYMRVEMLKTDNGGI